MIFTHDALKELDGAFVSPPKSTWRLARSRRRRPGTEPQPSLTGRRTKLIHFALLLYSLIVAGMATSAPRTAAQPVSTDHGRRCPMTRVCVCVSLASSHSYQRTWEAPTGRPMPIDKHEAAAVEMIQLSPDPPDRNTPKPPQPEPPVRRALVLLPQQPTSTSTALIYNEPGMRPMKNQRRTRPSPLDTADA